MSPTRFLIILRRHLWHLLLAALVCGGTTAFLVKDLPARDAPVTVTPAGRVMLHIEIDKAAEKARLEKLATRVEAEIANARAKLSNPTFADKAPPAVVEQEGKRLVDKEAELAQIRAQIGKLG